MTRLQQDLQEKLIAKSWKDEAFKQQLLSNPKAALQTLGVEIPADMKFEVLEETSHKAYFILPQKPSRYVGVELSDEQLETVAGGRACEETKSKTSGPTVCCWG